MFNGVHKTITPSGAVSRISMTDTSHLEDKQTPEMVSDQIKEEAKGKPTPENTAPEQKPEEKPAEVVPPKEEDKPVEPPKPEEKPEDKPADKPEDKKPEENLPPKPRTIYDDLKDKKIQVKEAKSEIELLKSQLAEKDQLITDLAEKAKSAETPAEKQEVSDDIKAIAEEIGASPEGIAKLTDFLTKSLVKPDGQQISKEDLDALKNFRQSKAQQEAQVQFAGEWNAFEPALKTEFPHVNAEDLAVVKKEVDRLAHTTQYHDKEIDYIYFKEKQKLAKLISPQRPSYEGSDNKPAPEGDVEVELSAKSSPMDVMKATSKSSGSALEIRSSK